MKLHPAPIHLLLTDVVMPNLDGRALGKQAELLRPDMAILYMTGYMDDSVGEFAIDQAGVQLVRKPFTPDGLLGRVRILLDRAKLATAEGRVVRDGLVPT